MRKFSSFLKENLDLYTYAKTYMVHRRLPKQIKQRKFILDSRIVDYHIYWNEKLLWMTIDNYKKKDNCVIDYNQLDITTTRDIIYEGFLSVYLNNFWTENYYASIIQVYNFRKKSSISGTSQPSQKNYRLIFCPNKFVDEQKWIDLNASKKITIIPNPNLSSKHALTLSNGEQEIIFGSSSKRNVENWYKKLKELFLD